MNNKIFKAGTFQFDVKLGDIESNLAKVTEGLHILGDRDVNMAVLPEMWSCGFDNEMLLDHARQTPFIIDKLSRIASKYNMLIAGSLPEVSEKNIFNTIYVIDANGEQAGFYRKIHLFSLTEEDRYFSAGNRAVVCDTSICPIGLMLCYDLRFPELCRSITLKGALVVIISAQWPRSRINQWDILSQARAIENQVFIIATNRCGKEKGIEFGGRSQIISPTGEILSMAEEEECASVAEINLYKIKEFRDKIPCLKERYPDAYNV
ncbi:MAG: carbon-nitrogen family hydrolase [Desulfobacteraceae bacterium]|nr:carbon-nitrogen family hydrolase [Desulfobacteraceae bacterium]